MGSACCVVLASRGCPDSYKIGFKIGGLEDVLGIEGVKVFHGKTKLLNNRVVTSGSRVLSITAYNPSIIVAQKKAYEAADIIDTATTELNDERVFTYRTDIASKAVNSRKFL